jgi:hypothetical protein
VSHAIAAAVVALEAGARGWAYPGGGAQHRAVLATLDGLRRDAEDFRKRHGLPSNFARVAGSPLDPPAARSRYAFVLRHWLRLLDAVWDAYRRSAAARQVGVRPRNRSKVIRPRVPVDRAAPRSDPVLARLDAQSADVAQRLADWHTDASRRAELLSDAHGTCHHSVGVPLSCEVSCVSHRSAVPLPPLPLPACHCCGERPTEWENRVTCNDAFRLFMRTTNGGTTEEDGCGFAPPGSHGLCQLERRLRLNVVSAADLLLAAHVAGRQRERTAMHDEREAERRRLTGRQREARRQVWLDREKALEDADADVRVRRATLTAFRSLQRAAARLNPATSLAADAARVLRRISAWVRRLTSDARDALRIALYRPHFVFHSLAGAYPNEPGRHPSTLVGRGGVRNTECVTTCTPWSATSTTHSPTPRAGRARTSRWSWPGPAPRTPTCAP